jgi:hypothetical protein
MLRRRPLLLLASLLPLTPTGATERGLSLRAEDLRVASVAYRIARSGAPYCADPYPLTGMLLHHLAEYEAKDQPLQIEQHRLDRGPGVLAVVNGSPAAAAGLLPGDVLLAINGAALPDAKAIAAESDRRKSRRLIGESESRLEEELRKGPSDLLVLRQGAELRTSLAPKRGCAIRARLARSDQRNAYADGRYVIITTKLLEFVPSDDELAFIIGHEAGHNILDHKTRLDAQKVPTGLFKSFGKNASRIRTTEEEADRLGLRLAWAAGYDPTAALDFWRRYYAKHDAPLQIFRTHPSLEARAKLMRETVAELERETLPGRIVAAN